MSETRIRDLAEYIFQQARDSQKPQFIDFDEIGNLQENVQQLRNVVWNVWNLMLQYTGEDMPRIYFYLSGKDVPLTALDSAATSPMGTRWIVLDSLKADHIQCLVEQAIESGHLSPKVNLDGLEVALEQWTGGSPRLLVYTLRVLHHLVVGHEEKFAKAEEAMEEVYEVLKVLPAVARDVFLAEKDEEEWREAWMYLILLAQLKVPCTRGMKLPVGGEDYSMEKLLGRLNVYISQPETAIKDMPDAFYVSHMKIVERFARERCSADYRVQLFLGDDAATVKAEDLLEHLVAQRIVVQACLQPEQAPTWGTLMSPLLQGTMAEGRQVDLDTGCPLKSFPKVTSSASATKLTEGPILGKETTS